MSTPQLRDASDERHPSSPACGSRADDLDKQKKAAEIIAKVRAVATEAARRADEIDEARAMPADLFDALVATDVLRSLTPKEYDGFDLPLSCVCEAIIEAARGNGSLGWLLLVTSPSMLGAGIQKKHITDMLLKGHTNVRNRGLFAPKGIAVPTEGGYRISGQWAFASGGPNPNFISGNCIVFENGKPRIGPDGVPDMLIAMMNANEVEPLDTWHVLGLRGTDSRDYRARDVFVPEDRCVNIFTVENRFDTLPARLPIRVLLSTSHCALAIGIALGALDDIIELSKTKRHAMDPKSVLADDPVFRHNLGEQTLRVTACKAMLDQVTADALKYGAENEKLPPKEALIGRTMSAYITAECVKLVDWAYTAGGSASVYNNSSLQRRLRDIHVATQHASCHTEPYRSLAAIMLGEELSPMELF